MVWIKRHFIQGEIQNGLFVAEWGNTGSTEIQVEVDIALLTGPNVSVFDY